MAKRRNRRQVNRNCVFCDKSVEPDYKEPKFLRRYLTDKGKIVSRAKTGVCEKHQKRLAKEVKRARHLALVPFVTVLR